MWNVCRSVCLNANTHHSTATTAAFTEMAWGFGNAEKTMVNWLLDGRLFKFFVFGYGLVWSVCSREVLGWNGIVKFCAEES